MHRSIDDVLGDRRNSLTFVRVALAALVVVAHSASLSGLAPHPEIGGVGLGGWAVSGFFVISGYVIAQSRSRLRTHDFLVNRALRILPAFWVVNLLTAAVAAPLAALMASSTVDARSAVMYVIKNAGLVINQWGIDGTLESVPYANAWNGSLWTLSYEAFWYVFVAVVFLIAKVRSNQTAAYSLLLVTLTALNAVAPNRLTILGAFFVAGMLIFSVRTRVKITPVGLVVAAALVMCATAVGQVVLIAPLPLGYLLLSASGVSLPSALLSADLSYGIYIYAFPVQQLLAQSGAQQFGLAAFTAMSFLLTVPLAWLSWRLVEAPALRLRRRARKGDQHVGLQPVTAPRASGGRPDWGTV